MTRPARLPTPRRFRDDRSGATAIEFAILALPFILTILAVLEYSYVYLLQVSLEDATAVAARQIRTGQAQTQATPMTAEGFKTLICNNMSWAPCTGLMVDAEVQTSWTNQTSTKPAINGAGVMTNTLPFNMGGSGSIVLIHAYYPWKMITPVLFAPLPKYGGNSVLLSAASVICNEPYGATASSMCGA